MNRKGAVLQSKPTQFTSAHINQTALFIRDKKLQRRVLSDFLELTKFKLSLLNSIGSYTMFYFHAPLAGVGLLNSAIFLFATQTVAMATQTFGQVAEAEHDAKMKRT